MAHNARRSLVISVFLIVNNSLNTDGAENDFHTNKVAILAVLHFLTKSKKTITLPVAGVRLAAAVKR
ncbi:hypothetical protein RJ498_003879 [Pluralibacter gergoviae]